MPGPRVGGGMEISSGPVVVRRMERHPEQVENKLIFRENNKIFRLP
jgi:hypothetical protein